MSFKPEDISFVDIFPPIAVARVGDSQEWYLGPEIPGCEPIPENGFKDVSHKIKRQAARFRVYAYGKDGKVLGEIDGKDHYTLKWTVQVANKKSAWVRFRGQYQEEQWILRNPAIQGWPDDNRDYAYTDSRTKLIINSGLKTVEGTSAKSIPLEGDFYGSLDQPTKVYMGDIRTDDHGRLVVLAGHGFSWSIHHPGPPEPQPFLEDPFNNDDWVDSMCDGNIHVCVKSKAFPALQITVKNKATIITAPPRFASGLHCPITLLEMIEDVYERQKRNTTYDVGEVNFYRDIDPIFRRMYLNSWTNFRANEGHGPRKATLFLDNPDLYDPKTPNVKIRENIFLRVRAPVKKGDTANQALRDKQAYMYYMPRLGGDNGDMPEDSGDDNDRDRWASLTELQYDRLAKWSKGEFVTGDPIVPYNSFDKIPTHEQPAALTKAALEWSIGAPLYPGIEVYWMAEFDQMYNLDAPFRFGEQVTPGDLTKGLSLPWQADFFMCNTHWWPSVRPDNIVTESDFFKTRNSFQKEPFNIAVNLTRRIRWDDGLDRREDDDRYGNSEMVRKWTKLGFVVQEHYDPRLNALPIYIEKERHPNFPHTGVDLVGETP